MIFIDTNYFLRFLLRDVENQHIKAKSLILSASEGKVKLFTSTVVFFEIYWVLSSYYGKNKTELVDTLSALLDLKFIILEERNVLRSSLELFEKSTLNLEDCYNLNFAKSKNASGIRTFGRKLAKAFKPS